MSYFTNEDVRSKLLVNIGDALRKCQHGGLLAILAHFTASDEPAILSLPTGSGKTELMFSAAFSLKASRVLIIEPSKFLRAQTARRLRELKLFRDRGVLNADAPEPSVYEARSSMSTPENWAALRTYDAVVATPKTVSPEEELVCAPPEDLFDLMFIDEAHHATAKTWRAVVRVFQRARTILLTATAFRRDRRRLPGRLVYHYPIGKALDDHIYRPVQFLPVERNDPNTIDEDLAQATAEKLRHEQELNPNASLMIRTDRIAKCEQLRLLYGRFGVEAVEIHSELAPTTAAERLDQLRSGTVKAVVTVGMMAEGIDIPGLKVASLHAPPRSLPYTLQLVGRVSRTPANQTGAAWLIASPEQVRGEARRLFREDRDWKKFIPQLVEDAIRDAHGDRADVILQESSTSSLLPEVLTPFFSIEVRKFSEASDIVHDERFPLDPDAVKGLPRDVESIEVLAEVDEGCVTVITASTPAPRWGRDTGLADTRHDLHILYAPPTTGLLFTATTSPVIMKALIDALVDKTEKFDPRNLQGVLSDAIASEYRAVGLENALGLTGTHPSYRIHLGSGSGSSVRPSDGSIYGPGHAMGRMLDGELRGVATRNRKVWSMQREPMRRFTAWCRELTSQLMAPGAGLPGLTFLAQPAPASEIFTEEPIGIVVADRHASLPVSALVQIGESVLNANQDPIISFLQMQDGVMFAALAFRDDAEPIRLSYRGDPGTKHWVLEDERQFEIVDPASGEREELDEFLNDHPPIILMPNGGAVRGDYGWKILREEAVLPRDTFEKIEWTDTDITKETEEAADGRKNVQKRTLEVLQERLCADAIIIVDDAAYEVADLIVVEPNTRVIQFVHCKFSTDPLPGNRVKDWYELFGQCARTHAWVRRGNLLRELDERIDRRKNTYLVPRMGSREDLKQLASDYKANEWHFRIYAVQPGCEIDKLIEDPGSHVHLGLGVVREWLMQAGAVFTVWGS